MTNIPYLIQVQLCIVVFWLVYRLFMRSSGAFTHNRIYLLGSVVLSFIIPALSIPVWPAAAPAAAGTFNVGNLQMLALEGEGRTGVQWTDAALRIAVAGIAVMTAGVIFHLIRMIRSVRHARILQVQNTRVVCTEKVQAPYSFFRYIFVNDVKTGESELPQIVAHEMAHFRLGHSIDSVFAQLLVVVFWWNPFIWLWCRSLKEVHEYQADHAVLKQGFDSKQYITLLIGTLADIHPEFVSGFSYSLIKNRLLMMTKQTGRFSNWKILTALPAIAATLLLFSFTEKQTTIVETTPTSSTETVTAPPPASEKEEPFVAVEVMPKFQGGDIESFRDWVTKQLKYPAEAYQKGIQGRVTLSFIVEKDGSVSTIDLLASPTRILSDEAVRAVSSSPKWTPGTQRGNPVRVKFIIPLEFKLDSGKPQNTQPVQPTEAPEVMVNGQPYTGSINDINTNTIESIDAIKTDPAYPNGLINITLKGASATPHAVQSDEASKGSDSQVVVTGYRTMRKNTDDIINEVSRSRNSDSNPVILLDGKEIDSKTMSGIDPESIQSMEVLKGEAALEKHGERGKNGVIVITSKQTGQ